MLATDNNVQRTAAEILTEDALENDGFNVSNADICTYF